MYLASSSRLSVVSETTLLTMSSGGGDKLATLSSVTSRPVGPSPLTVEVVANGIGPWPAQRMTRTSPTARSPMVAEHSVRPGSVKTTFVRSTLPMFVIV